MHDDRRSLTAEQLDALLRGVAAVVSWQDAATSGAGRARHDDNVAALLFEDEADQEPGRLTHGLIGISGQLLAMCADLSGCEPLSVLQAIAASYAAAAVAP